jgi:hypothetical protein
MMEQHERQLALDQLHSSQSRLLALVDRLTLEQWCFRESSGRWSIAENLEHLILFEEFIAEAIANAMKAPAEPAKQVSAAAKEPLVLGLANSRSTTFSAREAVRPTGRWPDPIEMVAEFQRVRARTLAFAAATDADLRSHFFAHIAFGDLDCYQWLLVLGRHTARHVLQIEQIKADPVYPVEEADPTT